MIQQRANFDWMLKELYDGVPGIQMIVVLSADGLRIARYGGEADTADRVAAACAGLQSLASAVAQEIPKSDGKMKMVLIEINGGYFYRAQIGDAVRHGPGAEPLLRLLAHKVVDGLGPLVAVVQTCAAIRDSSSSQMPRESS
ncbi:roadblock/LC7 domain-containing protein, partial [Streptomyces nigra]